MLTNTDTKGKDYSRVSPVYATVVVAPLIVERDDDKGCTISIELHNSSTLDKWFSESNDDIWLALCGCTQVLEYFGGADHRNLAKTDSLRRKDRSELQRCSSAAKAMRSKSSLDARTASFRSHQEHARNAGTTVLRLDTQTQLEKPLPWQRDSSGSGHVRDSDPLLFSIIHNIHTSSPSHYSFFSSLLFSSPLHHLTTSPPQHLNTLHSTL